MEDFCTGLCVLKRLCNVNAAFGLARVDSITLGGKFVFATLEVYTTPVISKQLFRRSRFVSD